MAPFSLMRVSALLLLLSASVSLTNARAPKVVSMPMYRQGPRSIQKRDGTLSVTLGNAVLNGLYYVNASVGTPPQLVQLQIDTGSSDVWMFGPNSCDTTTSPCLGGEFEVSKSSSATLIAQGLFNISYQTPGSGVVGDYIGDSFSIGGATLQNLTMAVSSKAAYVETGIMGIGFDTDESILSQGYKPYKNIIDVMVDQKLINTRAYSLWLDDINDATGTVLFGGYDSAKYKGELALLKIYPDAHSGIISSMTVAWSSLSLTDETGTAQLTSFEFPIAAVLDSGTTVIVMPPDLYSELADYFQVVTDQNYGALVACEIGDASGSLDFGFGGNGGPIISVAFKEFAIPLLDQQGNPLTTQDGTAVCSFGIIPASQGDFILLGDTFLRSAYVVYDLDSQQIGIAPTVFNTSTSHIVEIGSSNVEGGSSVSAGPSVEQTATGIQPASYLGPDSGGASVVVTSVPTSHVGSITAVETANQPTQAATNGPITVTAAPSATTTAKSSASSLIPPLDLMALLVFGSCLTTIVFGGLGS